MAESIIEKMCREVKNEPLAGKVRNRFEFLRISTNKLRKVGLAASSKVKIQEIFVRLRCH